MSFRWISALVLALALSLGIVSEAAPQSGAGGAAQPRSQTFVDAFNASVAAGGVSPLVPHTVPNPSGFSKINVYFFSTVAGAAVIEGSQDNGVTWTTVSFVSLPASGVVITTIPILFPTFRAYAVNQGASAASVKVVSSLTAN